MEDNGSEENIYFRYETLGDVGANLLSSTAAKEPVLRYLNWASQKGKVAQCMVERRAGHEAPHPVYPGQTVIQGTTLQSKVVWYKPLFGYFFEISHYYLHEPTNQRRLKHLYPGRVPRSHLMTRLWNGQNDGRVLLNCFVDLETAVKIASYFCDNQGSRWPGITWQTEVEMDWGFYLAPEDDWPNEAGPPIRPAWRVPLPEFETLRQQGKDWNDYF